MQVADKAIEISGLTKSFKHLRVLKGIDLVVERGNILALLGPNGAGKTTIIRILSTLLQADQGTAKVNGFDVQEDGNKVRENIGLTGQYAAVDEYLTGFENLEMFGRLYHLSKEKSKIRAKELLEQFDLVEAGNRAVKTYSGGMRRRLDLAASLIVSPPILFLDEPTTGLDPRSRQAMWEVIEKLAENKITVLLTTQYLDEADRLADKIAVLDNGKIIALGTADELKGKVGKERLELIIANENKFEPAVQSLKGLALETDKKRRSITVVINKGVEEVKAILNKMENEKIELEGLSLHKPTLDDVFMQLTGHKAEEEKMEEKI